MTAKEPPRNRLLSALLNTLRGRVGMGEVSLKIWGSQQHPPVAAYVVEDLARQLVKDGLATHEVKAIDGSSFYRPVPVGGAAPTLTPTPAPEVRVSKKKPVTPVLIDQLLAYCAGVASGPREGSVHSWLRMRSIPRVDAETLLEQLVEERRLERREKTVAGEVVVRYVVADPSVEPAPLPRSDAPEAANDDVDPGDPEDDEGAEDDPRAAFDEDPPEEACQRCERLEARVRDISEGNEDYRAQIVEARKRLHAAMDERDRAQGEVSDLRGRIEGWCEQLAIVTRERDEALREAQSLAAQARPALDPGAVGQYLLTLPGDRWEALTLARQHLAEAKSLAARAQELEAQALAAVDSLLDTTAGQAPAEPPPPPVEAPPVAAPSGETVREEEPTPPPSEEAPRLPPAGTLQYDVLQLVIKRGKSDAETLAGKLRESKQRVASALVILAKRGLLVRIAVGLYEPAPTVRRAA